MWWVHADSGGWAASGRRVRRWMADIRSTNESSPGRRNAISSLRYVPWRRAPNCDAWGGNGTGGGGQEGGDARRFPVAEFWPRRVDGCSWFVRLTTHHLLAALRSCFSAEFRFPLAPPTGDASSTNKSAVVRNISNTNPRRHPFSTRVETPLREQHSSSPRNTQRRKKKKQTPHTSLGSNARGSL